MKRFILTTMIFLAATVKMLNAQDGLAVAQLFENKYRDKDNVTEVYMEGKVLQIYDLSLFRSMTAANDSAIATQMEQLVAIYARKASDKEIVTKGGRIYYAFLAFNEEDTHRYIFFRNGMLQKGSKPEAAIIYMEGDATLENLKKIFIRHK